MMARIITTLLAFAAMAALCCPLIGAADWTDATGQPELVAAVPAASAAVLAVPPASQPHRTAVPPTQPHGSMISFMITRSLPQRLSSRQLIARKEISPADEKWIDFHGMLQASQKTVEDVIRAKKDFDKLSPDMKKSKADKAMLIEQVLKELTPEEQAHIISLPPEARAKAIMELVAQRRAKLIRDGAGNPNAPK